MTYGNRFSNFTEEGKEETNGDIADRDVADGNVADDE